MMVRHCGRADTRDDRWIFTPAFIGGHLQMIAGACGTHGVRTLPGFEFGDVVKELIDYLIGQRGEQGFESGNRFFGQLRNQLP
jgi:hypothetical protein